MLTRPSCTITPPSLAAVCPTRAYLALVASTHPSTREAADPSVPSSMLPEARKVSAPRTGRLAGNALSGPSVHSCTLHHPSLTHITRVESLICMIKHQLVACADIDKGTRNWWAEKTLSMLPRVVKGSGTLTRIFLMLGLDPCRQHGRFVTPCQLCIVPDPYRPPGKSAAVDCYYLCSESESTSRIRIRAEGIQGPWSQEG